MKHAREDYQPIQDPTGKIYPDEPVFLLRASDNCAPGTIQHWIDLAKDNGARMDIIDSAQKQVDAMREWQNVNGCKAPDLPA